MAVRQYIGARYVPKFYEFNNGVWQSNTEYEPLTIVQYNGNSYTSKKPVPSNIGNPTENGEYWVATGNYNAQVEAYKQDVDEFKKTTVTNLANRKFIFIADSYGALGWTDSVISRLNLNAHAINVGGAGFYGAGGGITFTDALREYASTLSAEDKKSVTDIIILAGINDRGYGISNIVPAIEAFITLATTTFVNAKIGCGCLSWIKRDNDVAEYISQVITSYNNVFSSHKNCYYIPDMYVPMHNYDYIQSDGVHPNADGLRAIVDYVCNWLQSGSADYVVENSATVTLLSGFTGTPPEIKCTMDKSGVDVIVRSGTITFTTPKVLNSFYALTNVAEITGGCIMGHIPNNATGTASITKVVPGIILGSDNLNYQADIVVSIYDGYIAISGYALNLTHTEAISMKELTLPPFSFRVGLLDA